MKQHTIVKSKRKIKKPRKIRRMGNITPTIDHYPRNGLMGDTDP